MLSKLSKILDLDFEQSEENEFTAKLNNSNHFSNVYSTLSDIDNLEIIEDTVLISEQAIEVDYKDKEYIVKLIGNFIEDEYKIIVRRE